MNCKKCGQDLTRMDYKKVAEWSFCLDCFQQLLDQPNKKESAKPEVVPIVEPHEFQQRCRICETEIEKDTGRRMLGMVFCDRCYDTLVNQPVIEPRGQSGEADVKPAVAQVRVNLSAPVQCHGCGRQIPAIGSKDVDGRPYCPDCYYALPASVEEGPQTLPETNTPNAGIRCQACNRKVRPENLKTVDGFDICKACLSTDPDTALAIARVRHKQALEKIKDELEKL